MLEHTVYLSHSFEKKYVEIVWKYIKSFLIFSLLQAVEQLEASFGLKLVTMAISGTLLAPLFLVVMVVELYLKE